MPIISTLPDINNIDFYRDNILGKMLYITTYDKSDIAIVVMDIEEESEQLLLTGYQAYKIKAYYLKDNSIIEHGSLKRQWLDLVILASREENLGIYVPMLAIDPEYFSWDAQYAIMVL